MTPETLARARQSLPPLPFLFDYGKDDFAFHLLARQVGRGTTIGKLKASPLARLLTKAGSAAQPNGRIDQLDVSQALAQRPKQSFPITARAWGDNPGPNFDRHYYQTARPGFNLVLQLNLPEPFWRDFRALCAPLERDPYNFYFHPARKSGPPTLGWARIDLDWDTREALIEELQSDWVSSGILGREYRGEEDPDLSGHKHNIRTYLNHVLPAVETLWPEALLWLCIHVLTQYFHINAIAIYDYETGNKTKAEDGDTVGPRSLYEALPKRFCFEKRAGAPRFLKATFDQPDFKARFKGADPMFWHLPKRGETTPR